MAREEINRTLALNPYAIDILIFETNGIAQDMEPEKSATLKMWT
jgi:hypothetical protein